MVSFLNYRLVLSFLISVLTGLALTAILPLVGKHPKMLMALPMAGLFFLMLVVNPRLTFVIMFLTRPVLDIALNFTKVSVGGQEVGFGAILNLIIILLAVFLYFYEGGFPRKNPVVHGWIIFLAVMMIAVVISPYSGRALRLYANYLSFFAMFLAPFLVIKRREDFVFWIKVFAWSFVLPVLYSNIDLLRGGQFYADAGTRIKGPFTHPNVLAFYLCLGLTYYFYLIKSRWVRIESWTFLGVLALMLNMAVLLLATKTRNAWIACFFSFFVYGWLKDRKSLIIMLMALPLLFFVPSVKDRVITVFNDQAGTVNYQGVNSFEWRLQMWKSSLGMISQRPLQGYGLTSFKEMSPRFSDSKSGMGAHNVYVEVLFESGMIGLIAFIILFFKPFQLFWDYMRKSSNLQTAALWAVVVGYVLSYVLICFADNLSYYLVLNWYVWFFIGLMCVSQRFLTVGHRSSSALENK